MRENVLRPVGTPNRDMHQGQSCGIEHLIHESITLLAVCPLMAFVIQLDTDKRLHGG